MIIDAHVHLWKRQRGMVNGRPVFDIGRGRSDFGGEIRQMLPPYMTDGENTAERLIANMDYAGVSGAVVTQEYIDGCQDAYLLECRQRHPDRLRVCALYREEKMDSLKGFDGVKICASRLADKNLLRHMLVFEAACREGKFVSIDLADGDEQTGAMQRIAKELPDLRIAVGHFGMVTRPGWLNQIELANNKNVFIECGGITWLFNSEFYPYHSAVEAIRTAAKLVGWDKLMWGSDYPRTMTAITYKMSLDFIEKAGSVAEDEKRLFLGENARRFYAFGDLPVPEKIKSMAED